ncbi:MAG: hypothetical protein ACRDJ4_01455 [Actinomycetota bacterium]
MADARVDELVEQAGFIFSGTVEQLGAAATPDVPVDEATAVVRVERVLQAPEAIGDQTGRQVTVRLSAPSQPGDRAVFFTTGWIYGQGLAVRELARRTGGELQAAGADLADVVKTRPDRAVASRTATAELIVVGKVVELRPYEEAQPAGTSEHDPQWWLAVLDVEAVEKGQHRPGTPLAVAFAASDDVLWYGAAKPRPGQDGVWLLRRERLPGLPASAYCVVDTLDIQPRDQLERVRGFLKG